MQLVREQIEKKKRINAAQPNNDMIVATLF